jgi:hypothetical protein
LLIDRTQKKWMVAAMVVLAIALVVYIPYSRESLNGPSGGSALGLTYGIVGFALMIFAGLLGARKKVPVWRLGKAQTWMRGHLWLGLLSLPLILFHAGFRIRGPLTVSLMVLFFVVIISGVFGAVLQEYLPRRMTDRVPMETIYDEIPHVRCQLWEEADALVAAVCGPLAEASAQRGVALRMRADDPVCGPLAKASAERDKALGTQVAREDAVPIEVEQEDRARLGDFYLREVRPFLEKPTVKGCRLATLQGTATVFPRIRATLPEVLHPTLDDLEDICEEERQLNEQERLHHWLHGWLIVHVPLSLALLLLAAVHVVMALRY